MLSLRGILRHDGLLARHLGQVAAAAVVARQDDPRVLVVARGVSEGLLGLGLRAGRYGVARGLLSLHTCGMAGMSLEKTRACRTSGGFGAGWHG